MKGMKIIGEIIGCICFTIAYCLLWVEKQIFFLTGYKGLFLRKVWKKRGENIQIKLDRLHGTNVSGKFGPKVI